MLKKISALLITASLALSTGCGSSPGVYKPHKSTGPAASNLTGPGPDTSGEIDNGGIQDGDTSGFKPQEIDLVNSNPLGKPVSHPFQTSLIYFSYDSAVVGAAYDDMIKAVDPFAVVGPSALVKKSGGKSDLRKGSRA